MLLNWKALLLALLAGGLLASAGQWGCTRWQRSRAGQHAEATIAARADHQQAADTVYFFTQGRRYEMQRQLDSLAHHAELPSPGRRLVLPAHPDRQ